MRDHTAGIPELKQKHGCRVVAPRKEASKIPNIDVTVREGDVVQVGSLVGRVHRDAGPHRRPHQLLVQGGQARLRGRHAVLGRLRPHPRGQSRDDVGSRCSRSATCPPTREVFCGHEYTAANVQFRAHHRAEESCAAHARRGSREARRAEEADDPDHHPAGKVLQPVPACRSAFGRRRDRNGKRSARAGVRARSARARTSSSAASPDRRIEGASP